MKVAGAHINTFHPPLLNAETPGRSSPPWFSAHHSEVSGGHPLIKTGGPGGPPAINETLFANFV
jgi:hypothetical protein